MCTLCSNAWQWLVYVVTHHDLCFEALFPRSAWQDAAPMVAYALVHV
jgi:hypothetical protein